QESPVLQLRVVDQVRRGEHGSGANAMSLQHPGELLVVLRRGPLRDIAVELVAMLPAALHRVIARVLRPDCSAHGLLQSHPLGVMRHRDGDPAIVASARVDVVRCLPQMRAAEPRTPYPALRFEYRGPYAGDTRFLHRQIDAHSLAGSLAAVESQQQGEG